LVADLLSDPELVLHTMVMGDLSAWDSERLFLALAAGDAEALRLIASFAWIPRTAVQSLPRYPKPWAGFIDLDVLVGDFSAACCRAGMVLPGSDPLVDVLLIENLLQRQRGQLAVRARLQQDYPWLGEAAWLATTGQLAEQVVLQGLRRAQVWRSVPAGSCVVRTLVGADGLAAHRYQGLQSPEVRTAVAALWSSTAHWDERGHLAVEGPAQQVFAIGGARIALGVGGLHSMDEPGIIEGPLIDLDVTSYYPSLIARDGIAPPQVPEFAQRTHALLQRRLEAKRLGDGVASTALKYVINSLYGQLGNARSGLFSPADALRVVLTGQVHLLQLMDGIVSSGGEIISANTDGIVVRTENWSEVATAWESITGLRLERTHYHRLWRTSVNDYVAVDQHGDLVKAKGRFGGGDEDDHVRRSAAPIIARAVIEFLIHQRPLAATINDAQDPALFLLWRRANGLHWCGHAIDAPVVRWMVAKNGTPLTQSTAQRVSSTVAAHAWIVIDPAQCSLHELDRGWYIHAAQDLVDQVLGTYAGAKQLTLFE